MTGNEVAVHITNVSNAQTLSVTLLGVSDGTNTGDISVPMGVLFGDVNASRRTDAGDVTLIRQQTVSIPSVSNFRLDVNASGRIDAGDVTLARQASVTALP